jgi:hypothetical protein
VPGTLSRFAAGRCHYGEPEDEKQIPIRSPNRTVVRSLSTAPQIKVLKFVGRGCVSALPAGSKDSTSGIGGVYASNPAHINATPLGRDCIVVLAIAVNPHSVAPFGYMQLTTLCVFDASSLSIHSHGGTINSMLSELLAWHSWRNSSSKPYAAFVYSKLEMAPQVAGPSMK